MTVLPAHLIFSICITYSIPHARPYIPVVNAINNRYCQILGAISFIHFFFLFFFLLLAQHFQIYFPFFHRLKIDVHVHMHFIIKLIIFLFCVENKCCMTVSSYSQFGIFFFAETFFDCSRSRFCFRSMFILKVWFSMLKNDITRANALNCVCSCCNNAVVLSQLY